MQFTYLLVNLGTILIPVIFSFHPKLRFYTVWKSFLPACLLVGSVFILWDVYFTRSGIWGFNEKYVVGINLINLPIEEWMFFFCIPYACVFTYHCFKILFPIVKIRFPTAALTAILILFLFITGIIAFYEQYTFFTFTLLGLTLAVNVWLKTNWLKYFYLSYIACLIPFFIVNGILTGSWIQEPVVWYNDLENLGIRISTIPLEDIFYGMLLILWNINLLEFFETRHLKKIE